MGRGAVRPRADDPLGGAEVHGGTRAIEAWLETAKPGDAHTYFTGSFLIQIPAVIMARRLCDQGEVILVQQRNDRGTLDYVMKRRANVEPPPMSAAQAGRRRPPPIDASIEAETERLMAVLRRLAERKHPTPTNRQLAEKAALKDADAARYRLCLLASKGRIKIANLADGTRVITIVASGARTGRG